MDRKIKRYEDLTFKDDFMFCKIMQNETICKKVLELILGKRIREIRNFEEQKTIKETWGSKGVRMDVITGR